MQVQDLPLDYFSGEVGLYYNAFTDEMLLLVDRRFRLSKIDGEVYSFYTYTVYKNTDEKFDDQCLFFDEGATIEGFNLIAPMRDLL